MDNGLAALLNLIKKLVLMIFEKYEVLQEFEALGIDIVALLNGAPTVQSNSEN